jgi:hypothetical protein
MKKLMLALFFLLFVIQDSWSCDICGCGVGSYYIGILPDFNKKIIGLRYRYSQMRSHIGINGSTTYLTTNEQYQTVELWGAWNLGKKFRFMANIPQHFNMRTNLSGINRKSGLGDISFIAFYRLLNKRTVVKNKKLLVQSLWIGTGLKLPTGEYNPADKQNSNTETNLFQLGTASLDYSLNLMYDIRYQDAGFNLNSSYKINSENQYGYSYGNKFNLSAQVYYKCKLDKHLSVAPNAGILFETSNNDIDQTIPVDASGGQIVLSTFGTEAIYKKITFGLGFQTPVSQQLANGMASSGNRFYGHISFLF